MVAYGDAILEGRVPQWQPYYIDYMRLKGFIKEMERDKMECARISFEEELRHNIRRTDAFYAAQESRLQFRVMKLPEKEHTEEKRNKQCDALKDDIEKLLDFAEMNCEGLRKITKKFDKSVDVQDQENDQLGVQHQTMAALRNFPVAHAKERLEKLLGTIQGWQQHQSWKAPFLEAVYTRNDALDMPLLKDDRIARYSSAVKKDIPRKVGKFLKNNVSIWILSAICAAGATYDPIAMFTSKSYFVCWVTLVVLVLLIRQKPPAGALVGATLLLTVVGILEPKEAWAAFSNDVVLSVGALGCVATAVGGTGVVDLIFSKILGKPKSLPWAMTRLFLPAIVLNVCISNTCVMSCLLPVLDKWSVEIGYHKAMFLAPLSYVLLISGVFATFSTSTNLIAQGMLTTHGQPPFEKFELAPIVGICTLVTLIYLMVATPIILKRFQVQLEEVDAADPAKKSRFTTTTYVIRAQIVGKAIPGKTLTTSGLLDRLGDKTDMVVSCERYGELIPEEYLDADFKMELDDVFVFKTTAEGVVSIRDLSGVLLLPLDSSEAYIGGASGWHSRELVEVVLDQSSRMVKHRLVNSQNYFPRGNDCSIVGYRSFTEHSGKIHKDGSSQAADVTNSTMVRHRSLSDSAEGIFRQISGGVPKKAPTRGKEAEHLSSSDLPEKRLAQGDHLIFDAPTNFYQSNKENSDFVVVRRITVADGHSEKKQSMAKAYMAGFILFSMIVLVASGALELLEAVLTALCGLVLTGCTSLDIVVKAVKLETLLTIVGAFGLGVAIGKEHVADALADLLLWLLSPFGAYGLLIAIFFATVALGVVFHGTAVVVLMYPICDHAARKTGAPIHQIVSVLCIAVSCQMLSPISYQTNLMAYTQGGYEFADFTKLGAGLVLVLALVAIPLCKVWFADGA